MFTVYEDNKPCTHHNFPEVNDSWDNATFSTLESAQDYAVDWFFPYLGEVGWGHRLEVGVPFDYGMGNIAIIKEE